jgi:hypothetical protein
MRWWKNLERAHRKDWRNRKSGTHFWHCFFYAKKQIKVVLNGGDEKELTADYFL